MKRGPSEKHRNEAVPSTRAAPTTRWKTGTRPEKGEDLLKCRNDGGKSTAECFLAFLYEFQKASRNFAKRQITWFRNEPMYHWIDASRPLGSVIDFVCSAYIDQTVKLVVPRHLQMKKDVNERQENNELKSYRTKNTIFRAESDCLHVLDWVWRTQRR